MNGVQDPDPFGRLVAALEPWLDQVVIVGGWAHQLYRLHPDAQELDYQPLTTLDTDVAVPSKLPVVEQDIRQRLLAYGFAEEFFGDDHPPVTHYHLGGQTSGFYAEFLTPLIGGPYDRDDKRKATMEIAGITSQRLRYIELFLSHPWSIGLDPGGFAARILEFRYRALVFGWVAATEAERGKNQDGTKGRGRFQPLPGDYWFSVDYCSAAYKACGRRWPRPIRIDHMAIKTTRTSGR